MNTVLPTQRRCPHYSLVTGILIWLGCFAILASVIISKHLHKTPHLFAYARTIDQHEFQDCPLSPPTTAEVRQPQSGSYPLSNHLNQSFNQVELCDLFNKPPANECRYIDCKNIHICFLCCLAPHTA